MITYTFVKKGPIKIGDDTVVTEIEAMSLKKATKKFQGGDAKEVEINKSISLHSLKLNPITPPFAAKTSTVSFILLFIAFFIIIFVLCSIPHLNSRCAIYCVCYFCRAF